MTMKKKTFHHLICSVLKEVILYIGNKFDYVWSQILHLTDFQSNKWNSPIRLTFVIVRIPFSNGIFCYSDYGTSCLNTFHVILSKQKRNCYFETLILMKYLLRAWTSYKPSQLIQKIIRKIDRKWTQKNRGKPLDRFTSIVI